MKITRCIPGNKLISTIAVYLLLFCSLAGILAGPVSAGERFVSGSPDLSAAVQGVNEFSPGQDATIPVSIQNSGLITYEYSLPGILTRIDLPNTAKLMVVTLDPGSAPITVKSDPQMVGDLAGGGRMTVSFRAKIDPDAEAGTYILPLRVRYTYLREADQYATDVIQYFYKDEEVILGLPVHIRPEIVLEVTSVGTEHVNVGTEGYARIELKNIGNENGRDTVATLSKAGNSPVTPTAGSVYIGDFPTGSAVPLEYRVSVSKDAEAFTYPMNISVTYKNLDGDFVTSTPVTIGIPVDRKIDFSVVSSPEGITPGSRTVWEVVYRNTGDAPVHAAEARIITVDPFTTDDDSSYLGDIPPGETGIARFEITVDSSAVVKDYGLDSEIRYRDALDNDQISDRIKVPVHVTDVTGIWAILGNPYILTLIGLIVAGAGYFVLSRRRKKRS
ncbi:MAG: S-layer protein [Methanoregulaceae archaeon]|nr:S-layer protein [Methanoregulaceae archaeon]